MDEASASGLLYVNGEYTSYAPTYPSPPAGDAFRCQLDRTGDDLNWSGNTAFRHVFAIWDGVALTAVDYDSLMKPRVQSSSVYRTW